MRFRSGVQIISTCRVANLEKMVKKMTLKKKNKFLPGSTATALPIICTPASDIMEIMYVVNMYKGYFYLLIFNSVF